MNGPPATAVESTIIPFSSPIASAAAASSITTLIASKEATLTSLGHRPGEMVGVAMPQSGVVVDAFEVVDRHRIVFQMVLQFIRAADIKLVSRRALELLSPPLDVQRIAGCRHRLPWNFLVHFRAMASCRALEMMIVQLNSDRTSSADIVVLPSGVAFSMANFKALTARRGAG